MESEILNIFNEHRQPLGTASREDVHRLGHWHETFHCWFITKENGRDMIYLQLRSPLKKDYPDLLDITAAGHLLATETVEDGVREIQEETGIQVAFDDLHSLGIIPYSMTKPKMIDNELAHVFVYRTAHEIQDFRLQFEEVAGMYKAAFQDFADLWLGNRQKIDGQGFVSDEKGKRKFMKYQVSRSDFVPHPQSYYEAVLRGIETKIKET